MTALRSRSSCLASGCSASMNWVPASPAGGASTSVGDPRRRSRIGGLLGAVTGRLVVYLRTRHDEAVGLDEFLGLGLVAMAYGIAQLASPRVSWRCSRPASRCSVCASGHDRTRRPLAAAASSEGHSYETLATHSHHASATMRGFGPGLQRAIGEAWPKWHGTDGRRHAGLRQTVAGRVVVRSAAASGVAPPVGRRFTLGERLTAPQFAMIGWFGIRGIGSVFYLLLALRHGVDGSIADTLVSLTLWTVAASIIAHGLTAQPLMQRYLVWRRQASSRTALRNPRS